MGFLDQRLFQAHGLFSFIWIFIPLHWNILVLDMFPFYWDMLSEFFRNYLRNVLPHMLDCKIVRYCHFSWYNIYFDLIFVVCNGPLAGIESIVRFIDIIDNFFLIWNILDPAISFYNLLFKSHMRSGN